MIPEGKQVARSQKPTSNWRNFGLSTRWNETPSHNLAEPGRRTGFPKTIHLKPFNISQFHHESNYRSLKTKMGNVCYISLRISGYLLWFILFYIAGSSGDWAGKCWMNIGRKSNQVAPEFWVQLSLAKDTALPTNSVWPKLELREQMESVAISRNGEHQCLMDANVQTKLAMCCDCNSLRLVLIPWNSSAQADFCRDDSRANDHRRFANSRGPSSPWYDKIMTWRWKGWTAVLLMDVCVRAAAQATAAISSGRNSDSCWVTTAQKQAALLPGHRIKLLAKAQKTLDKYLGGSCDIRNPHTSATASMKLWLPHWEIAHAQAIPAKSLAPSHVKDFEAWLSKSGIDAIAFFRQPLQLSAQKAFPNPGTTVAPRLRLTKEWTRFCSNGAWDDLNVLTAQTAHCRSFLENTCCSCQQLCSISEFASKLAALAHDHSETATGCLHGCWGRTMISILALPPILPFGPIHTSHDLQCPNCAELTEITAATPNFPLPFVE